MSAALRLLADDLTGALDSAARFTAAGSVPVFWSPPEGPPPRCALDAATRDAAPEAVAAALPGFAAALAEGQLAFKKIDSVLRGHVALELDVCVAGFDHAIVAPAFPHQGRVMRNGDMLVRGPGGWQPGPHRFPALGRAVARCRAGQAAPAGVSLWDAESDEDLAAIVEAGLDLQRRAGGRLLWCGAAGLAGALAARLAPGPVPRPDLPGPVLALIGTNHPVAMAQLALALPVLHRLEDADVMAHPRIADDLAEAGAAAVCVALPADTSRAAAAARIGAHFAELAQAVPRPGSVVVAGGETLRRLMRALDAQSLMVDGEIEPGIPAAIVQGGHWHGLRLVARSGGFGEPALLARLLGLR